MKRITSLFVAFCFVVVGFAQTVFPTAVAYNYGGYYNDQAENVLIALTNEETFESAYIELQLPLGTGVEAVPAGTYPINNTYAVNTAVAAGEDAEGYLIGCLLESVDLEAFKYIYKLVTDGNVVVAVNEGVYTITMTGSAVLNGETTSEEFSVTYTGELVVEDKRPPEPIESFEHTFTEAALMNYYDYINATTDNITVVLSDGEEGQYLAQFDILAPLETGLTVPVGTYNFVETPMDMNFENMTSGTALSGVFEPSYGIQLGGLLVDYDAMKVYTMDNGVLTIAGSEGNYTITVTTAIDYFANEVTLSYSGPLTVVEGEFTSNLKSPKQEAFKAYGVDGTLYIDTETANAHVQVIDMLGRVLVNDVEAAANASYYIGTNQIVLVRVNGQSVKVKM